MRYKRMPIEIESPEQLGYNTIRNNLSESSYSDTFLRDFDTGAGLKDLALSYGSHQGHEGLRDLIARDGAGLNPEAAGIRDGAGSARGGAGLNRNDVLLTIGAGVWKKHN